MERRGTRRETRHGPFRTRLSSKKTRLDAAGQRRKPAPCRRRRAAAALRVRSAGAPRRRDGELRHARRRRRPARRLLRRVPAAGAGCRRWRMAGRRTKGNTSRIPATCSTCRPGSSTTAWRSTTCYTYSIGFRAPRGARARRRVPRLAARARPARRGATATRALAPARGRRASRARCSLQRKSARAHPLVARATSPISSATISARPSRTWCSGRGSRAAGAAGAPRPENLSSSTTASASSSTGKRFVGAPSAAAARARRPAPGRQGVPCAARRPDRRMAPRWVRSLRKEGTRWTDAVYESFDTREGFQAAVERLLERPGASCASSIRTAPRCG